MHSVIDVSVIIPAYNAPDACVSAIKSILSQQNTKTEIIVIEDGSRHPCLETIQNKFPDLVSESSKNHPGDRQAVIRYFSQTNIGAYRTRIHGVQKCSGEFVKFLDHDDFLLGGALEREVQAIRASDADVLLTNWQIRYYDDNGSEATHMREYRKAPTYADPIDDFLRVGGCYTSAALFRKSAIADYLKPVKDFTPIKADDWLIFAQICLSGARYETLQIDSYAWTVHGDQLSNRTRDRLVNEHYMILHWIETELRNTNRMTAGRQKLLANYYAKQILSTFEQDQMLWKQILEKIYFLDSNYRLQHGNLILRLLCRFLGVNSGVPTYIKIKKLLRRK